MNVPPFLASRCIEFYTELFVKLVVQTGLIRVPVGSPVGTSLWSVTVILCLVLFAQSGFQDPAQAMCINLTASFD